MLSENSYQYIVDNYPETQEQQIAVIRHVINMFFDQFSKDMEHDKNKTVASAKITYQRLCLIWDTVADRLDKEGKPCILKGGYKKLMESKPEFHTLTQ